MKNKKFMMLVVMTFSLGIIMLFGSSYSLIISENDNKNIIRIPEFNNFYQDSIKVSILNNKEIEYNFEIINTGNRDIKYRIDITPSSDDKINKIINYSYIVNNYKSDTYTLSLNNNIIQNHLLNSNMKDKYQVNFFFKDVYDSPVPFETTINIYATYNNNLYATEELESMHSDDLKKINGNMIYISNNPNNYVWFNCKDNYQSGTEYCEKWRIIGSFDQNIENGINSYKSLKLVKDLSDDEITFNLDEMDGKYNNSYINSYLNGAYYEKMSDSTKKLIMKAKWNIGDVTALDYEKVKEEEKKNIYYAYIGLPSPSDYLVDDNNWMTYDQTILLLNKNNDYVNVINNGLTFDNAYDEIAYVPSVYLRSDVSFIDGDGSFDKPYALDIVNALTYGKK